MQDLDRAAYAKRAKQIRKYFRISQLEFAQELGYSSASNVGHIETKGINFNPAALEVLETKYKVNIDWLETGRGSMLRNGLQNVPALNTGPVQTGSIFPTLQKHGDKNSYTKDNLQILVVSVDNIDEELVEVVPEKCLAGYAENGFRDPEFFKILEKEMIPADLRGRGTIRKFQVDGKSMEDTVHHGDWVYCSYMPITSMEDFHIHFRNGFMYVLNTYTRGLILKRVWHKHGDYMVICESDNEDQNTYAPFHLELNDIREWWYWRRTYTAQGDKRRRLPEEITKMKYDIKETNHKIETITHNLELIVKSLPTGKDLNLNSESA